MELVKDHRLGVIGLQSQLHPAEITIGELNNSVVKRIGMPYTVLQTVLEFIHGPWPALPVDIGPFPSGFIPLIPVIQMHALFVHRPQGSHGLVGFHNIRALSRLPQGPQTVPVLPVVSRVPFPLVMWSELLHSLFPNCFPQCPRNRHGIYYFSGTGIRSPVIWAV